MTEEHAKDPLALGLGSLAGGVGFGAAFLSTAQVWVALNEERYDFNGMLLTVAPFVALAVGGIVGWYRSYALENIWQRGVIAVLAAIGAFLIGILAAPINTLLGPWGMTVWVLLNIALGILATRWAIKGKGSQAA